MGQKERSMVSIVLTKAEHNVFTDKWRKAIPHDGNSEYVPRKKVMSTAREIYRHYPEILKALNLQHG